MFQLLMLVQKNIVGVFAAEAQIRDVDWSRTRDHETSEE